MSPVLLAVVVTLIVNEATDVSPWIAIRLARWAAKRIYAGNTGRAARRQEEWEALISKSIPTKISQLFFGLGFGCAGLYCIASRRVPAALAALGRRIRPSRPSADTVSSWIAMAATAVLLSLPGIVQVIVLGGLVSLWVCVVVLAVISDKVKSAGERRRLSKVAP